MDTVVVGVVVGVIFVMVVAVVMSMVRRRSARGGGRGRRDRTADASSAGFVPYAGPDQAGAGGSPHHGSHGPGGGHSHGGD